MGHREKFASTPHFTAPLARGDGGLVRSESDRAFRGVRAHVLCVGGEHLQVGGVVVAAVAVAVMDYFARSERATEDTLHDHAVCAAKSDAGVTS